jgi:hypothetical protein
MKQQTSDHLDVLIITYQSEIPERYDFEIVEPIKEDSEIAIALYLKSEKELLRYESFEIDLLKIEAWLADVASKIYMIDKVVEIYEPFIIVDDSSDSIMMIEIKSEVAKHVIIFDLDLDYQLVNIYASSYFHQTTATERTVQLDVDSNSSLLIEGSDFFMHYDNSTSCSIQNISKVTENMIDAAEDFILSIES